MKLEKRRELTKEEKEIYLKQKERFEEGGKFFIEEIEIIIYKINTIAPHEYKQKLENLRKDLETAKYQWKETMSKLYIINEHLEKGVEVKEKKEEIKNG